MNMKHTPGPWTVGDTPAIVYDDNACEVAIATFNQESFEANARLIAAAPELLAALEMAEATIKRLKPPSPHDSTQGTRDVIRNAINKATGND